MPLLWRQSEPSSAHDTQLRCSFCGKSKDAVRTLLSSPSEYPRAYICNECIEICTVIVQDKEDPFVGNPLASEFFMLVEDWITRESAGLDASQELSRMRSMAQGMFAPTATDVN